jgi:hypothetical protein
MAGDRLKDVRQALQQSALVRAQSAKQPGCPVRQQQHTGAAPPIIFQIAQGLAAAVVFVRRAQRTTTGSRTLTLLQLRMCQPTASMGQN